MYFVQPEHFYIHKSKGSAMPCWAVAAAQQLTSPAQVQPKHHQPTVCCHPSALPASLWALAHASRAWKPWQHLGSRRVAHSTEPELWPVQRNPELTENDMFWFGLIRWDSLIWIRQAGMMCFVQIFLTKQKRLCVSLKIIFFHGKKIDLFTENAFSPSRYTRVPLITTLMSLITNFLWALVWTIVKSFSIPLLTAIQSHKMV